MFAALAALAVVLWLISPAPAPDADTTDFNGATEATDAAPAPIPSAAGANAGNGSPPAKEEDEPPADGFEFARIATGLDQPVQVLEIPDQSGRLLIVEQTGTVRVLDDNGMRPEPFLDISAIVSTAGTEQGLLSIAFHPRFPEQPDVFVSYTGANNDSVIARYRLAADRLRLDEQSEEIILRVEQPARNHNGGLIQFGPDGYLYIGLGDGGGSGDPRGNGQNPNTLLGAILRIEVDVEGGYAVPIDNPFPSGDGPERSEIWALGLRNPWRFSFDRATGDLYIADVGQNDVEEINFQPAGQGGQNYGWNIYEGRSLFKDGEPLSPVTFPIAEYSHGDEHCSVTGGYVYRGSAIPALQGVYLYGDYCSGTIWALKHDNNGWRNVHLTDTDFRIAAFGEDLSGELYVVDHTGSVYRMIPGRQPIPDKL